MAERWQLIRKCNLETDHQEHKLYPGWPLSENQWPNLQQNVFMCMTSLILHTGIQGLKRYIL